ncbi:solute carrier family 15 member 3-like [Tubulanus polymorphus]|uniref:solute carrier family 15 member 3-like n=1 Tax=Tubulanus polymorphus TaxID=672921 RepID=UPI003DA47332
MHSAAINTRRVTRWAFFVILATIAVVKYSFYAISYSLVQIFVNEMGFDSPHAVFYSLMLGGSCYIFSMVGGCLGQSLINYHRVVCAGLFAQLVGAGFLLGLGICIDDQSANANLKKALFYTFAIFEAICMTLVNAALPVLGAKQVEHKGEVAIHDFFAWYYFATNVGSCLAEVFRDLYRTSQMTAMEVMSIPMGIMAFLNIPLFISGRAVLKIPKIEREALDDLFSCRNKLVLKHIYHVTLVISSVVMTSYIIFSQCIATYASELEVLGNTTTSGAFIPPYIGPVANNSAIIIGIPIYLFIGKHLKKRGRRLPRPLARFAIGQIIAVVGVMCAAVLEYVRFWRIQQGQPPPDLLWQIPQYFIEGVSEIFVFVSGYEFIYNESPPGLHGFLMGLFFCSWGLGSWVSALLAFLMNMKATNNSSAASGDWYPTDLKHGHMGRYFFLLAGIGTLACIMLLAFSRKYVYLRDKNLQGEYERILRSANDSDTIPSDDST